MAELQRLMGNRAVARLISRAPGGPGAPPKRPPITGSRSSPENHIKDMSLDRAKPTFAQIYMAVKDAQFTTVFDGDLVGLDRSELQTLDSVSARQIDFYSELARQQAADPDFVPPEGVPDLVFRNVVREFRSFREERLAPVLKRAERRVLAPALIEPWAAFIESKYGGKPIGEALVRSLGAARVIVEAEMKGQEYEFSEEGLLRYGYLDPAGVRALRDKPVEAGATDEQAAAQMHLDAIEQMREKRTILGLKLANAFLSSGSGDPADTENLVARIEALDVEIGGPDTIAIVQQKRVGGSLFGPDLPPPQENLIFDWMVKQSRVSNSVYGAYAEYIQGGE